jgi:hypothetical protein
MRATIRIDISAVPYRDGLQHFGAPDALQGDLLCAVALRSHILRSRSLLHDFYDLDVCMHLCVYARVYRASAPSRDPAACVWLV